MLYIIFFLILFLFLSTFKFNLSSLDTVNIICGLPGTGKTTTLARLTKYVTTNKRLQKCGYRVYSNVPVDGAYPYSWRDEFGMYDMSHSLICLDEAGLEANNRDFKSFKYCQLEYIKLLRHRDNVMCVFSQTWDDMDLKIRTMAGSVWLCEKCKFPIFGRYFTKLVPVKRTIAVDEDDKQLKDIYYIHRPIARFFTTRRFFRPLYYRMFDSFEAPELPPFFPERLPYAFHHEDRFKPFKGLLRRSDLEENPFAPDSPTQPDC